MTREEAVKRLKERIDRQALLLDEEDMAALTELIPELCESEDERIIKRLSSLVNVLNACFFSGDNPSKEECLAYLEKQKELFKSGRGLYYYDGEKTTYCGYPATEDNPYDFAISQQEKQKEQKPAEVDESTKRLNDNWMKQHFDDYKEQKPVVTHGETYHVDTLGTQQVIAGKMPQKPAEWSAEDEKRIQRICDFLWKNRKGDTDTIYQIEKDVDWLKSLRPSWKPSEEQMDALKEASASWMNARMGNAGLLESLYEQLKKLM